MRATPQSAALSQRLGHRPRRHGVHSERGWVLAMGLLFLLPAQLLCSGPAAAQAPTTPGKVPELTILYTSRNYAEIDPCGCSAGRIGGLARRSDYFSKVRRAPRPVLALDAGEGLYQRLTETAPDAAQKARARAILDELAALRYDALAPGPRDVAGGLLALNALSGSGALPVISSNLVGPKGTLVFPAARVIERGGARVGVIGVSSADLMPEEARAYLRAKLTATEPAAAVRAALKTLPKDLDLVIVLGCLKIEERRRTFEGLQGVQLGLVSSSGMPVPGGERVGKALVFDAAMRGQVVSRLDLRLGGPGPIPDPGRRLGQAGSVLPPRGRRGKQIADQMVFLDERYKRLPEVDARLEEVRRPIEREEMAKGYKPLTPDPKASK